MNPENLSPKRIQTENPLKNNHLIVKPSIKDAPKLHFQYGYSHMNDEDLYYMSHSLKSFTSLQEISIELQTYRSITNTSLQIIGQGLKQLSCLQHFQLSITDLGIYEISKALKSLASLKSFCSVFRGTKNITDRCLSYLEQGLQRLTICLKTIDLRFLECIKLTETGLLNLRYCLKRLTRLKNLSLKFESCPGITDSRLKYLAEEYLVNLQSLSLSFCHFVKIADLGLQSLGKYWTRIAGLNSLSLNYSLDEEKITFFRLYEFLKGWENFAPGFQNLDFFENQKRINTGMHHFSSALKSFISLQSLKIEFKGPMELTNESLSSLSKTLGMLVYLKEIILRLGNYYQITKRGFYYLNTVIKGLICLQGISLGFPGSRITNLAIENFFKVLNNKSLLKEIGFDISKGPLISSEKALGMMGESLRGQLGCSDYSSSTSFLVGKKEIICTLSSVRSSSLTQKRILFLRRKKKENLSQRSVMMNSSLEKLELENGSLSKPPMISSSLEKSELENCCLSKPKISTVRRINILSLPKPKIIMAPNLGGLKK